MYIVYIYLMYFVTNKKNLEVLMMCKVEYLRGF